MSIPRRCVECGVRWCGLHCCVTGRAQELWEEEQRKLATDIREKGLSLAVFADWYNVDVMKKIRFFDQNTQQEWTPVSGGAHLPALNEFLEGFGIAFTTRVLQGLVTISGRSFEYASGATLYVLGYSHAPCDCSSFAVAVARFPLAATCCAPMGSWTT